MKKFNLMQILPSLNSGGVEQGTIDLANHIAKKETKNYIVSNGGRMLSYLNKKHVTHFNLPVHSKNFFKMPFLAKKINNLVKTHNINILHFRSRAPAWMLPYINKKNLTTVSTFHNVYGTENLLKRTYNKALGKTDYIIAISKYVREEIINHYNIDPNKIRIINRGIDIDFYNPKIINEKNFINFIRKNNIEDEKKIILFPGRLTRWKGQFEFLDIIEAFQNKPYHFYFVGDDKNKNYKEKLIAKIKKKNLYNNCKILGHLNNEDLKMMYSCADLVISMPLKPEGFGRIIAESLAMKKIVLAYNFGGAKNQLEKLDDLYKINKRDKKLLTDKINHILNLPLENFETIKEHSRNHVLNYFSKQQMLENYTNLYEEIIS
tara:strand:- start:381 stop:1511 length:1131 start_codon:yes stop_codon:yes gene_type:complete